MSRDKTTLAILFADIAKSTQLYEALGNRLAQQIINRCLDLLARITTHCGGTIIKTIGDEIMCTFPSATAAVDAAKEMNQSLEALSFPEKPGYAPPNIYVGIQYGPVILEDGDVFGDAVNVAARMVALAKQRQIVTTQETIDVLPPEHVEAAHQIDKTVVKGKSGEMVIYEIIWEQQDVTVMMDDALDSPAFKCRIELRHADQTVEIDENRPSASLGRQLHNDVVVQGNRVSRSHAKVEYRRGKFVLIDQSTNGTFVTVKGKQAAQVKRDELGLIGSGVIGLGQEVSTDSPDAIHFAIKM